jgi:hypothetical protein
MSVHEENIKQKMQALGITSGFLAALSGVNPTRFSLAFSGQKDFDNTQVVLIENFLTGLEELTNAAAPLPLALVNAKVVRGVLDSRRNGNLWIDVRIDVTDWEKTQKDNGNTESNS